MDSDWDWKRRWEWDWDWGMGMVVPLKPALQAGVASRRDKAMRTTATGGGGGAASGSKNILTAAQCNQRSRKV